MTFRDLPAAFLIQDAADNGAFRQQEKLLGCLALQNYRHVLFVFAPVPLSEKRHR